MSLDASELDSDSRLATGTKRKVRLLSIEDLDGRTRAKQAVEDLRSRLIAERGGADRVDALQAKHLTTVAVLSAMIEDRQARWLLGQDVDAAELATLINSRRREAERVGAPEPKDITPSLSEYLAAKAAEKSAHATNAKGDGE